MKCGKSVLALIFLLGLAANGIAAGTHGSRFSAGRSPMFGSAHIGSSSQFSSGNRFHGNHHFDGIHRDGRGRIAVFIGVPLFLSGYGFAAPYYSPPTYIEQGDGNTVWYYCDDPQGYYPDVTECAAGWQTVVGNTPAPE